LAAVASVDTAELQGKTSKTSALMAAVAVAAGALDMLRGRVAPVVAAVLILAAQAHLEH
jgi:hypothetical protein